MITAITVGQHFGRLTVKEILTEKRTNGSTRTLCVCLCSCGKEKMIYSDHLKSGATKSCGCLRKEIATENSRKHGYRYDRIYNSWRGMKERCHNQHHKNYEDYGGRGITVCSEWLEFVNFCKWAEANGYQEKLTIDRINPDGNYEPKNCRWITTQEQQKNKRVKKENILCKK